MTPCSAVLFDLDGTLIDSEPLHFEAHRIFLATIGITPTGAELAGNIGKGDRTFYRSLMAARGVVADPEAWVQRKTDVLMDLYRAGRLVLRPGVRETLAAAERRGIPCAVVTSSERRLATLALEVTGIAARLPVRVVSEDVAKHKPEPEPYLRAATLLGIDPAKAIAIEDSVSGVRSAKAAGCYVVASSGIVPDADLLAAGADRADPDLHGVARLLG